MIKKKLIYIFLVIILILVSLNSRIPVSAAEDFDFQLDYNGYSIKNYEISAIVNGDDSLDITEYITVDFSQPKHGIYRAIPLSGRSVLMFEDTQIQQNYLAKVKSISVKDAETKEDISYSMRTDNNALIIQIGNAHKTLTGEKTYELHYRYALKTESNTTLDYLNYNLIGTGWDTSLNNVHFSINMPADFETDKLTFFCGPKESRDTSEVEYTVADRTISGSVKRVLDPGEGLTAQLLLPEGYFQVKKEIWPYVEILIFVILAVISLLLWFFLGRNHRSMKILLLNEPPEDLNPAEAAYVLNESVNQKAVSAMLLHWANLGFLSIADEGKHFLRLIKRQEPDETLQPYEKQMLNKLFEGRESVTAAELKDEFYKEVQRFERAVREKFETEDLKLSDNKTIYAYLTGFLNSALIMTVLTLQALWPFTIGPGGIVLMLVLGIAVWMVSMLCSFFLWYLAQRLQIGFWGGFFAWSVFYAFVLWLFGRNIGILMLQPALYMIGVIAAGVCAAAGAFSNRRTEYGLKMLEEVLGYRRYINHEMDFKKAKRNIEETYYHDFAYAYAFGLSKKWAAAFAKIIKSPPEWYVAGQTTGFEPAYYMLYMDRSLDSFGSTVSNSYSSSGGGGAGGGAGGGGGGSW